MVFLLSFTIFFLQFTFLSAFPLQKRNVGYVDPNLAGGSMLIDAGNGYGEPMNVIVSGNSSPEVLTDSGFLNFANAIGFSSECLNLHGGGFMTANLGDGHGSVPQAGELRQNYGLPDVGTCLESLIGGNHFRTYHQNGPTANTGALFLAVSKEENLSKQHTIVANGYNIGRDLLVRSAVGERNFNGVKYTTTVQTVTGLLPPGVNGINHGIAQDGATAVLEIQIHQ